MLDRARRVASNDSTPGIYSVRTADFFKPQAMRNSEAQAGEVVEPSPERQILANEIAKRSDGPARNEFGTPHAQ